MDPTVLLQILITALTTLLENCPEKPEQKVQFLRKPKLIHRARLEVQLKREGLGRVERQEAMKLAAEMQAEATDADLLDIVTGAA